MESEDDSLQTRYQLLYLISTDKLWAMFLNFVLVSRELVFVVAVLDVTDKYLLKKYVLHAKQ